MLAEAIYKRLKRETRVARLQQEIVHRVNARFYDWAYYRTDKAEGIVGGERSP